MMSLDHEPLHCKRQNSQRESFRQGLQNPKDITISRTDPGKDMTSGAPAARSTTVDMGPEPPHHQVGQRAGSAEALATEAMGRTELLGQARRCLQNKQGSARGRRRPIRLGIKLPVE